MDLDGWTEEQVRVFLREQPEKVVRSAVRDLGVDDVLFSIFTGMAGRFAPDRRRSPGRLLFVLTDGADEHCHALDVGPDGARVSAVDDSRAVVTVDVVRFLKLGVGAADAGRLLLTRRLRVNGDRLWTAMVMRGLS